VRGYFIGLDSTEAGRKKLQPIKVQGYAAYDRAALMALGTWLGFVAFTLFVPALLFRTMVRQDLSA